MKKIILFACALVLSLTSCGDSFLSDELEDNKAEIDATTVDFTYSIIERTVTFTSVTDSKVNTLILRNIPIVRSWNALWRLPKNNKYYKLQSNDLFVDVAYNALHSDTDD